MQTISRQEYQNMLDLLRNRLSDRLLAKNDYITLSGQFRDKIINQQYTWHLANQQLIKQTLALTAQAVQHTMALESRVGMLEQELRGMRQAMEKATAQHAKTIMVMPVPGAASEAEARFQYNPT